MAQDSQEHVPSIEVLVDGQALDDRWMSALLEVQVKDNALLPDTAVVRLKDPSGEHAGETPLAIGKDLEIKMGGRQDAAPQTVFKGDLAALEPEFRADGLVVAARAYDKGHRLNRNRHSRTFQNQKAEDMIRSIAGDAGLTPGTIESTSDVHAFFQQSMETDWDFGSRLATMNDFELTVDGDQLHFRKRASAGKVATLEWTQSLFSFKPRLSGVGQVEEVTVTSHDPKTKRSLTATATSTRPSPSAQVAATRSRVISDLQGGKVSLGDRVVTSDSEARALAQSALDRLSSSFLEAEGVAEGSPKLRTGAKVEIANVGQFSGEYVLSSTTHSFRGGGKYLTSFVIAGRSPRTLKDLVRTNGRADWGANLVVGLVTNVNDPDDQGRVRVKFPALGDDMEGWWARVTVAHAGKDRGLFFLPQVGDEVVVGFENGDTRRPYVLGSLYNGKDKPPADLLGDKKGLVGIKSIDKAHVESDKAMTIRSKEKMIVEVKTDNGPGDYSLDAGGKVEEKSMKDFKVQAGQNFEVSANQAVTIKGTGSVTVEATGSLKLKGAMIDIEASGIVNVKGSMINLG